MSFYQPSLSLYDVLNALASQNGARNEQQQQQEPPRGPPPPPNPLGRHGHGHGHPHPHPFGAHGHGPHGHPSRGYPHHRHGPPSFGFPGTDPFQPSFGLPNYGFSRMPQQGYYYSPQYDYPDEDMNDEDEENEAEEQDNVKQEEDQQQYPSYYHDESGKYNRGFEQEQPSLTDILNALMGGASQAETEKGYNDADEGENGKKYEEEDDEAIAATADTDSKAEETISQPEPERKSPPPATKTSTLEKPTRSFAHLSAPTPIPDPLQISKPETRLDLPFSPEVNVYNLDNAYVVVLALPGANSKSFKIDYHPSSHELLVKGKVIDRLGIDEQYLKITEIKYGAFERTVKFPVLPRIQDEEIKATYSNGLLQIKVPKLASTEKPQPKKRITIEDIPDAELEFEQNPNPITDI
ncbi:similar to Saccharomyces cerevisiae YDR171W HSP42 Small heat shock protein (sHSP) with chaperone activity [Maudiozyma barnettii]|uniref:Similar to Saccharomyces cerevisiae YDR171W HSP42 Small heat shock protein (SHSP) with chaperone activity n=1 Tax=Maudiozyma barnettii TaxID=61262 RepID=A0A8H2VHY2_9SACH|nr:heat shock protein HSP42 [Kazachstania barnettii]CAB4255658.1 similar to Saccharomyces cerevisiae YDR171W HSP42 Small heat shock protein (sHSP) with chaperone activity [Kazachstania barnettii]CAD1784219.1 similar to Saccharomyces cerevisiae YDR171W HSP42 Small heat shock protein (sHSP) with chaperone activity [Kazachstania barnettii]